MLATEMRDIPDRLSAAASRLAEFVAKWMPVGDEDLVCTVSVEITRRAIDDDTFRERWKDNRWVDGGGGSVEAPQPAGDERGVPSRGTPSVEVDAEIAHVGVSDVVSDHAITVDEYLEEDPRVGSGPVLVEEEVAERGGDHRRPPVLSGLVTVIGCSTCGPWPHPHRPPWRRGRRRSDEQRIGNSPVFDASVEPDNDDVGLRTSLGDRRSCQVGVPGRRHRVPTQSHGVLAGSYRSRNAILIPPDSTVTGVHAPARSAPPPTARIPASVTAFRVSTTDSGPASPA